MNDAYPTILRPPFHIYITIRDETPDTQPFPLTTSPPVSPPLPFPTTTTTTSRFTDRLHFLGDFCGPLVVVLRSTIAMGPPLQQSGGGKDACELLGTTSSSASGRPWLQPSTTPLQSVLGPRRTKPHRDRRQPGQLGSGRLL